MTMEWIERLAKGGVRAEKWICHPSQVRVRVYRCWHALQSPFRPIMGGVAAALPAPDSLITELFGSSQIPEWVVPLAPTTALTTISAVVQRRVWWCPNLNRRGDSRAIVAGVAACTESGAKVAWLASSRGSTVRLVVGVARDGRVMWFRDRYLKVWMEMVTPIGTTPYGWGATIYPELDQLAEHWPTIAAETALHQLS